MNGKQHSFSFFSDLSAFGGKILKSHHQFNHQPFNNKINQLDIALQIEYNNL